MNGRPVVALVCDVIHPYSHGGREIRYHELSQRLAERAEMHVYTMHWWDGPPILDEGNITYHAISPQYSLYKGHRRAFKQALFFALACVRLLRYDFDVVEADHIPYLQIYVLRFVVSLRRKRLVVTWHEVWSRQYWHSYLGWFGHIAWFLEWLAMRLPDHIIAASHETAERLRETLGPRASITVAPNGIDLRAIREVQADSDSTDVVAVGRLMEHKRLDLLLNVVAMLHADGLGVTCRIIGDGPERDSLRLLAEKLGISHAVDFRRDVNEQKDLYSLVKAGRIFVSLSDREGFGIAVLEALACGVPVVTTSAPDNLAQHLVAQSPLGVVCEPSAQSVFSVLRQLLSAPADHLDSTDDSWLEVYDWDVVADQVAKAYGT